MPFSTPKERIKVNEQMYPEANRVLNAQAVYSFKRAFADHTLGHRNEHLDTEQDNQYAEVRVEELTEQSERTHQNVEVVIECTDDELARTRALLQGKNGSIGSQLSSEEEVIFQSQRLGAYSFSISPRSSPGASFKEGSPGTSPPGGAANQYGNMPRLDLTKLNFNKKRKKIIKLEPIQETPYNSELYHSNQSMNNQANMSLSYSNMSMVN